MSFLSSASRKVGDMRAFLKAAGDSSIRYRAEKGATHQIYFPYRTVEDTDENGQVVKKKEIIAISGKIHEWTTSDGKFHSVGCSRDIVDGDGKFDGSCPFCDRVDDAWKIVNYRKETEESRCQLTGKDREDHLKASLKTYLMERKAKKPSLYLYILVAQFKKGEDGRCAVNKETGLPEYELKVMKISQSRADKIQQQIQNSGAELPGSELIFQYTDSDDVRLQVSQGTTTLVFPNMMLTTQYPALLEKIHTDVSSFDWDEISEAFPEWKGMPVAEAKKVTDNLFSLWDQYQLEVSVNPQARYAEYLTSTNVTTPSLGSGDTFNGFKLPTGVGIPDLPQVPNPGQAGAAMNPPVPPVAQQGTAVTPPTPPVTGGAASLFGGATLGSGDQIRV